jgi:hypothetical protein
MMAASEGGIESIMRVNHADIGRQSAREKDLSAGTVKISKSNATTQTAREIGSKNNLEV